MLSKQIYMVSVLFTLISCAHNESVQYTYKSYKPVYKKVADKLVNAIQSNTSTKKELIRLSEAAIISARPILKAFSNDFPKCKNLVNFMLKNENEMKNLFQLIKVYDFSLVRYGIKFRITIVMATTDERLSLDIALMM